MRLNDYLSSVSHRLLIPDELVKLSKWTMDTCGNDLSLPNKGLNYLFKFSFPIFKKCLKEDWFALDSELGD